MKSKVAMLALGFLLVSVSTAQAQFWEKKDWKTWSEAECKKMLEDSPWGVKYVTARVEQPTIGAPTGGTGRVTEQQIGYSAHLRSALPVRQAIIRLAMIQNKYDKMTPEQKAAFDKQAEEYVNRSFEDRIVIHVNYWTNLPGIERELANLWQSVRPDAIPVNIYLMGRKGTRIHPARFVSPPGSAMEFEVIFPRIVDGQPIVDETTKNLMLELPGVGFGEERLLLQFKAEKMKFKGEQVY